MKYFKFIIPIFVSAGIFSCNNQSTESLKQNKMISSFNKDLIISGNVTFFNSKKSFKSLANSTYIASNATVSLINPLNDSTIAVALTEPNGNFSLFKTSDLDFNPSPGNFYVIEARRRAENDALLTLRTIVKVGQSGNWLSISGPAPIRINTSTTAVSIAQKLNKATLSEVLNKVNITNEGIIYSDLNATFTKEKVQTLTNTVEQLLTNNQEAISTINSLE